MARSINDSLTLLENSRNDIVDALNSKIEGGGIEKTLKISEIAEKINSIETGGGESKINHIKFWNPYDLDGMKSCAIEMVDSDNFKIIVSFDTKYADTQLYFIDPKDEENFTTPLKKNNSTEYETENINIDEFLSRHSDGEQAADAFIQGSQNYDFLENVRTPPHVIIEINQNQ